MAKGKQASFDFEAGQREKKRGMEAAEEHAGPTWMDTAVEDFVDFLVLHGPAALESWREDWINRGMPAPASVNAYGCVAQLASRRHLIVATGRWLPARSVRSHGHHYREWDKRRNRP